MQAFLNVHPIEDADFIAHSRADIPFLLAYNKELQEKIKRREEQLKSKEEK
jgi:hypothetical protein